MLVPKDDSVQVHAFTNGILFACQVIDWVFARHGIERVVVSSGHEPTAKHSVTSLHYSGNAIDCGYNSSAVPPHKRRQISDEIREALGLDYDVVHYESHMHVECQPRRRDAQDAKTN
ncbi:MAG: hypothetical protein AAF529_14590 [Pseudomonadota bacterium]